MDNEKIIKDLKEENKKLKNEILRLKSFINENRRQLIKIRDIIKICKSN